MTSLAAPPRYKRRENYERPPRASPAPSVPRSRSRSATPDTRPRCYHCNSPALSQEDGATICQSCGVVNESDGNFRAEIEFDETANGGAKTRGTHIGAGQSHARNYVNRVTNTGVGQEAADASERAKSVAQQQFSNFCINLRINDREKNRALHYFNMAYKKNFYRGRTLESVAVVCLYLAIRHRACKEKYPIMLIDFAEISGGAYNVWELGKMFKALQKLLYLDSHHDRWNELERRKEGLSEGDRHRLTQEQYELFGREETALSLHDPEDLIERFCERLDFGDMTMVVKRDAVQVAKSMNRDWMSTGRRPAGIAGAAIIIAARMSNFRRTLREVVLVAKVTELTLSKRIEEFKETKSSSMSVQDFRAENVEGRPDALVTMPPSLYRTQPEWQEKQAAKNKRKRKQKKTGLQKTAAEIENGEDAQTETDDDNEDLEETVEDEPQAKRPRIDADGFAVPAIPVRATNTSHSVVSTDTPTTPGDSTLSKEGEKRTRAPNWQPPPPTDIELAEEEELSEDIRDQLRRNASLDPTGTVAQSDVPVEIPAPGSGVLDIYPQQTQKEKDGKGPAVDGTDGNTGSTSMEQNIGSDEFEDDLDVANCVLTESERVIKETIWVTENADWLRTEHAKKIKRELKEREMREKGIDPEKERLKNRRRKDGTLRNGQVGDIRYLEEARRKQGDNPDGGEVTGNEDGDERRRSISRRAQESAQTMIKQRGTFSRRVDYQKLSQAYVLPGFEESSESRSESPESQHFLRPATGRGTQASAKRRARQAISRITGELTLVETDGETDAENNSPPATSRSQSRTQAEQVDVDVDDPDEVERPSASGSARRQPESRSRPSPSPVRQLPTPAPTQSQTTTVGAAARQSQALRKSPIVIEGDDEADDRSESPLSSTHTPAGYGSGAPGTPLATANKNQQRQVEEIESDGDDDDYVSDNPDDPDTFLNAGNYEEDDEDEEGDDGQEQLMGEAEEMMGEAEEVVDDEY